MKGYTKQSHNPQTPSSSTFHQIGSKTLNFGSCSTNPNTQTYASINTNGESTKVEGMSTNRRIGSGPHEIDLTNQSSYKIDSFAQPQQLLSCVSKSESSKAKTHRNESRNIHKISQFVTQVKNQPALMSIQQQMEQQVLQRQQDGRIQIQQVQAQQQLELIRLGCQQKMYTQPQPYVIKINYLNSDKYYQINLTGINEVISRQIIQALDLMKL